MTTTPADSSPPGLVFAGRLPLAWHQLANLPDEIELRTLERSNLANLRTLFALEIHAGDSGDDPVALASANELKRLDFKVGILLELVGQLYARQQAIPPERALTLTTTGLIWRDTEPLATDCALRLDLYCNLNYPRPLVLHARVTETVAFAGGWEIRTLFQEPSESLQEALERYIFLQHRRAIAHSRRGDSR
jgi:hypothetical protein